MKAQEGLRLVERGKDGVDENFRRDVLAGLKQDQKAIPARWFYDAHGSALFEKITELPEYYPTRTETAILRDNRAQIAELIGAGRAVVEFGSGSSIKTPLVLGAIDPAAYVPLDISGDFLRASAQQIAAAFPGLAVHPVEADFNRRVALPDAVTNLPKVGFFPGSTIGNMVARTAVDLLRSMRETLGEGAMLLIGMDLIKPPEILHKAYDDAAGVTAQFNRNLITRINRELSGTMPSDMFAHRVIWNDVYARIEMHLEACEDVTFSIAGEHFSMQAGETIHTENSHKFTWRSARTLLLAGQWTPVAQWTDPQEQFALILAHATVPRGAP